MRQNDSSIPSGSDNGYDPNRSSLNLSRQIDSSLKTDSNFGNTTNNAQECNSVLIVPKKHHSSGFELLSHHVDSKIGAMRQFNSLSIKNHE